jgi:hypothetical protein
MSFPVFFYVQIDESLSYVIQLLHDVPQGSILGPLLFILYATPLRTVVLKFPAHHRLYADDARSSTEFLFLGNINAEVYSSISGNLLLLNPYKHDSLLLGLRKQHSYVNDLSPYVHYDDSVSPVASACNLGIQFYSEVSSSDHISSVTKSCIFV